MIGNNDVWIAALAWEAQLTLVTNMKRYSGCGCAA
jgi:predicted nucleic acid-binding protein